MPNPYLTLVDSWKDLPNGVSWSDPDVTGNIQMLVPLELAGVTVGSFTLRGTCHKERIDRDVLFQLEVGIPGKRTRLPLSRIEWRPVSGVHKNPPLDRKPSPPIFGSHHHAHLPNWLESQGRMREGNLPFAEALDPDPPTYEAFLDLVRTRFRINGIDQIGVPAWEPKLV
jgi:hypothetical protein